jgi:type IV pilus assembly protein PilV
MSVRGKAPARGFSLVEVMVALIVICVGLLGIAKMQGLSLSTTTTSRLRSLAAFEAAGLAAAMHTNRQYWVTLTPATVTVTVPPPPANPVINSPDGALSAQATADIVAGQAANGAPGLNNCVGSTNGVAQCTAVNLAAYDLARWTASLQALLPNPTATITCPPVVGTNPTSCTIQITWTERAIGINSQEAAVAPGACQVANGCFLNPTYVLYVEP